MIMGVQRSGTTVLFDSLAADQSLTAYPERPDSPLYDKFLLRPEWQIRPLLRAAPGSVLLKPISETNERTAFDVMEEYRKYDVNVIWIYRDPTNVFHSMIRLKWVRVEDADHFSHQWVQRNRQVLRLLELFPERIILVRYEDLAQDIEVLQQVGQWMNIRPDLCVMRTDSGTGQTQLPAEARQTIEARTGALLAQLDAHRTFRPHKPTTKTVAPVGREIQSPAYLDDLYFWLSAEDLPIDSPIAWADRGPHRLAATAIPPGLLNVVHLAQGTAAEFSPDPGNAADGLKFGQPKDWDFLYSGNDFTLTSVLRPVWPARLDQSRVDWRSPETEVLLQIKPPNASGELFRIHTSSISGLMVGGFIFPRLEHEPLGSKNLECTVGCFGSPLEPHKDWKIITMIHQTRHRRILMFDGRVNIGQQLSPDAAYPYPAVNADAVLHVGGQRKGFQMAELIIYRRALAEEELLGLVNWLSRKYAEVT